VQWWEREVKVVMAADDLPQNDLTECPSGGCTMPSRHPVPQVSDEYRMTGQRKLISKGE